jgi:inorganic pyrophosphatase
MAIVTTTSAAAATHFTLLAGSGLRSCVACFPTVVRFQRQRGFTTIVLLKTIDLCPME